jgi:hypothetical protein
MINVHISAFDFRDPGLSDEFLACQLCDADEAGIVRKLRTPKSNTFRWLLKCPVINFAPEAFNKKIPAGRGSAADYDCFRIQHIYKPAKRNPEVSADTAENL